MVYTLCRGLCTFPHKTRSPPLDFSHYMVFEKRMTETQSFRSVSTLRWIGRYTYIILHLLAHPGRGHTNYSTKPEPVLACGFTRKLLDMRIRVISLSRGGRTTTGAPPWISHACSHCTSPPFKPNLRPGSSLSYLGSTYYFVTHLSQ